MKVMKFGGASIKAPENFLEVADLILEARREDPEIVVVISAMANQTDQLVELAKKVHPSPPKRELDMLISVGERMSVSLLAMALSLKGQEAISFTGSQSGIITSATHSDAEIVDVRPHRLQAALGQGKIAIVAGFQGVSRKGEITTLGRGGSDTTAVALAVSLGAGAVDFYKDVEGIYDKDPKKGEAKIFQEIGYKEAWHLSLKGAKVLHARCIALAQKNGVVLNIRSFKTPEKVGTMVGKGVKREEILSYETVEEYETVG